MSSHPDTYLAEELKPAATQWPIVGHEWAVRLLQRSLEGERGGPSHAYLFLGPGQIGKTSLGKAFAKAVFCRDRSQRPCGHCRSCRLMDKIGHPDFRFVQPSDRNGDPDRSNGLLRVEQAVEVVHEAMLRPVEGHIKFFLLQDVHQANDSFSNKLLKTLEEPPDHVLLCLTAVDRSSLLPTIVSRCQVIELRPVDSRTIEQALVERWQAEQETAHLLAGLASGRPGWAIAQLSAGDLGQQRQAQLAELRQLVAASRVERLHFAQKLAADRDDQRLFDLLATWTSWWRDILLTQCGCIDSCRNSDYRVILLEDARQFEPVEVRLFLRTLGRFEGYLHHTVNTGLALDVLLLQLPRPRSDPR